MSRAGSVPNSELLSLLNRLVEFPSIEPYTAAMALEGCGRIVSSRQLEARDTGGDEAAEKVEIPAAEVLS